MSKCRIALLIRLTMVTAVDATVATIHVLRNICYLRDVAL
jgi:hypothetical protein